MKEIRTEILIVGYGFAGAVAAIAAHDRGARVVLSEKMEHFGGCSILSGGGLVFALDPKGAFEYFKALCGGRTPDAVIQAQVNMMSRTVEFMEDLCKVSEAKYVIRSRPGIYPLPGRGSLNSMVVREVPNFTGYPWLHAGPKLHGYKLMKVFEDNILKRKIRTLMSAPARELVVNGKGEVTGAVLESGGTEIKVRANKAVILACGGFEHNEWLRHQYLEGKPYYSMAPLGNTGDGIVMSQQVGARLWHMWHLHGSYGFKYPGYEIAFRHHLSGARDPYGERPFCFKMRWIVVDQGGRRFMNEYPPAPQDTPHRALGYFNPDLPGYPRIPCYLIFDEKARREGPISDPMGLKEHVYAWSPDNSKEIEKGWIISAPTLEELAQRIHVQGSALNDTVRRWNDGVREGHDADFGRLKDTMFGPIETPPFYAMEAWPIVTNTQGGPEHDEHQRVINYKGEPVVGLYAVGELGSMFGHMYELGGNLGECISSGRIAGMAAASETR
jgi:succinate dehydrogenase/fumarate reductase flavoprotein subunit